MNLVIKSLLKFLINTSIVFALILLALYFMLPSAESYTNVVKRDRVSELMSKISQIKTDYSEKLLTNPLVSETDTIGLKAYDLKKYGLKPEENVKENRTDRSSAFEYMRRIELTPKKIIVTFGEGFDGNEEKTIIVEVTKITQEGVGWGCKSNLSNKFRPDGCES